ncbi:patatin-like phospholipase family protein [bacterium]|nr:patatin-like phospholipase family protein [bacterium]
MEEKVSKPKKYALFLSGGGARGSFQVGALKHLIGDLKRNYSIVSGFSIGALSGSMIAQDDFLGLLDMWQGVDSFFDVIAGNPRFYKGLLSMKPLRKLLEKKIDVEKIRESPVEFFFSAVDLQRGINVQLDKNAEPFMDWLLASASLPGVFPPMEIGGHQYVDGGVLAMKPLAPCIKAGADVIDVILCAPLTDWSTKQKFDTIFENIVRSIELAQTEIIGIDIANCRMINKEVAKWRDVKDEANFIENFVLWKVERKKKFPLGKLRQIELNIIEPPADIIGVLEISKDKIKKAIDLGYKKAVDLSLKSNDN